MVKGLMTQFTINVKVTGFVFFPALITSAKSILTMIGYIIKKRQIAMGIEMTGAPLIVIAIPSNVVAAPGATLPNKIPIIMHSTTHTERNFSKKLIPLPSSSFSELFVIIHLDLYVLFNIIQIRVIKKQI